MTERWITPAEKRVLNLLCEGRTNPEIAKALFLSTETVKYHMKSLIKKHTARNRTHLVVIVLKEHEEAAVARARNNRW